MRIDTFVVERDFPGPELGSPPPHVQVRFPLYLVYISINKKNEQMNE